MIFKENLTSKLIQAHSYKLIKKYKNKKKILEIGCGDGNISNYLIKKNQTKHDYYLSDISKNAIKRAKKNISYKNAHLRVGKFFNPWKNENLKFNIIISDISSINDTVAKLSPWYKGVVCNSGKDGLKNVKIILNQITFFMSKKGYLIIPIISLCDHKKLDKVLKKKFLVKYTEKKYWPLPIFFENNIKLMKKLKNKAYIDFKKKFNINTAFTSIAICKLKVKKN